jgi:hypothetical protein
MTGESRPGERSSYAGGEPPADLCGDDGAGTAAAGGRSSDGAEASGVKNPTWRNLGSTPPDEERGGRRRSMAVDGAKGLVGSLRPAGDARDECVTVRRASERVGNGDPRGLAVAAAHTTNGGGPGAAGVIGSDARKSARPGRWWAWSAEVYSFCFFFEKKDGGVQAGNIIGPSRALRHIGPLLCGPKAHSTWTT